MSYTSHLKYVASHLNVFQVYDVIAGRGEDTVKDAEVSILPKMVSSSRPNEGVTRAADSLSNLPFCVWKSLLDKLEDPKASIKAFMSIKT